MATLRASLAHRLLQAGTLLFGVGLLTGFAIPMLANPRMGLSSHLEGVMNGLLLLLLGAIWPRLRLGALAQRVAFGLAMFGTWVNWFTTLVAAALGAGSTTMPLAATGYTGSELSEALIGVGLISLSLAMIAVCALVLWGLRGGPHQALSRG